MKRTEHFAEQRDAEAPPPLRPLLVTFAAAIAGEAVGLALVPVLLPGLARSFLGPEPKGFWYLARSSGVTAYVALWLATLLGLLLSTKMARRWLGASVALELHRFTSLLAIVLAGFHMLVLLGDQWVGYTVEQLLVPFASSQYRPVWVGLGQLAFYGLILVFASFWIRPWIGTRGWRTIHYGSFGLFALATVHGIGAGTDAGGLLPLYEVAGFTVLWGLFLRLLPHLSGGGIAARPAVERD